MIGVARSGIGVLFANIKIIMILGVVSGVLYFLFQYGEGRAAMVKAQYLAVAAEETQETAERSIASVRRLQVADAASDERLSILHDTNTRLSARIGALQVAERDNHTENDGDISCPSSCLFDPVPWDVFDDESL